MPSPNPPGWEELDSVEWVHLGLEALQDIRVQLHQILPAHPGVLSRRLVLPPHKVALIYSVLGDNGLFIQYSVYLSMPVPLDLWWMAGFSLKGEKRLKFLTRFHRRTPV